MHCKAQKHNLPWLPEQGVLGLSPCVLDVPFCCGWSMTVVGTLMGESESQSGWLQSLAATSVDVSVGRVITMFTASKAQLRYRIVWDSQWVIPTRVSSLEGEFQNVAHQHQDPNGRTRQQRWLPPVSIPGEAQLTSAL